MRPLLAIGLLVLLPFAASAAGPASHPIPTRAALDAEVAALNAEVARYNGLVEQLTALDADYAELYSALDPTADPGTVSS